jgi:pyruvate dehydrogenase E2 component (dihydrolipoamide acetyltransferase)
MAHDIVIPRLGWSMEVGTFVGWSKRDGDPVRRGDVLFELEGEKACQDIEAVDEGILRIPPTGPQPGAVLKVGAVVGYLVEPGEAVPWNDAAPRTADVRSDPWATIPPGASPAVRRQARKAGIALTDLMGTGPGGRVLSVDVARAGDSRERRGGAAASWSGSVAPATEHLPFASPRARRVAAEVGVDWRQLAGTGAGGRIRERDVRAAAASGGSAANAPELPLDGGQRVPLTSRRRKIAQRMVASRQQTVPVTLMTRADATNLVHLRDQFKTAGGGAVPSYQDIITKLVAEILPRHPLLAGRWDHDAIVLPAEGEIHIGMAVDTEQGLLVPVIRNPGSLSLVEVAETARALVARARSESLSAAEMQGGVFTITNLGAFGIDAFTPIINTPETAILGLGAIRGEPVIQDDGQIAPRHLMALSLTFDHRVLDGAPAARFLQDLVNRIAKP